MGLILVETGDGVGEEHDAVADMIGEYAQKLLGDEYKGTSWYFNSEDEHLLKELMSKLIENIEG